MLIKKNVTFVELSFVKLTSIKYYEKKRYYHGISSFIFSFVQ